LRAMGTVATVADRRAELRRRVLDRFNAIADANPDLPKRDIAARVAEHTALGRVSARTVLYWVSRQCATKRSGE